MADSLFRVAVKGVIFDAEGRVLVVKESGRTTWGLPGGGIEYGETIRGALERELKEEINLTGDFSYVPITVADPKQLATRPVHQINLVFRVLPETLPDGKGVHADDARFIAIAELADSPHANERASAGFATAAKGVV